MSQSAGRPLQLGDDDITRFWALVLPSSDCWAWMASIGSDGYGRFALRLPDGRQRTVTPHQVAAVLAYGEPPAGATLLHDCEVRLCVRTGPGHVRVGTQAENMQQAAHRGRSRGPHPGLVDTRGPAGASRAVQAALRASAERDPVVLALVLRELLAARGYGGRPFTREINLFAVGQDGRVWTAWYRSDSGTWNGWVPILYGTFSQRTPVACNRRIRLFAVGQDGHVYWTHGLPEDLAQGWGAITDDAASGPTFPQQPSWLQRGYERPQSCRWRDSG